MGPAYESLSCSPNSTHKIPHVLNVPSTCPARAKRRRPTIILHCVFTFPNYFHTRCSVPLSFQSEIAMAIFRFKQERLKASETTAGPYEAFILCIPAWCSHESLYLVLSISWETDALSDPDTKKLEPQRLEILPRAYKGGGESSLLTAQSHPLAPCLATSGCPFAIKPFRLIPHCLIPNDLTNHVPTCYVPPSVHLLISSLLKLVEQGQ